MHRKDTVMSIKPDTTSVLSQEQKEMLFFIYQEEKMVRDVYMTLGRIYQNETAFKTMQRVEEKYLECAKRLCDIYGIDRSSVNEGLIGAFESPLLKILYDAYMEKGTSSLGDALEIANYIEATHKDMIEHASVGMPSDVVSVYEKLKRGNMNQLESFESVIYSAA